MRIAGPASTLCTMAMTWLARFSMETSCQSSGSLPPNPGRLGLMTRQPSCSARRALSRQYMPPPAKKPWMFTAQIGGVPGPSGPCALTLSDTAKRSRCPSTMMELGTMRMVGFLRILRVNWSRTTPRPWAAWPASTRATGDGPSEGPTMAPEICSSSSDGASAFDLNHRTAITTLPVPRRNGTSFAPPADSSGP